MEDGARAGVGGGYDSVVAGVVATGVVPAAGAVWAGTDDVPGIGVYFGVQAVSAIAAIADTVKKIV